VILPQHDCIHGFILLTLISHTHISTRIYDRSVSLPYAQANRQAMCSALCFMTRLNATPFLAKRLEPIPRHRFIIGCQMALPRRTVFALKDPPESVNLSNMSARTSLQAHLSDLS
jgi:hypothetical protein